MCREGKGEVLGFYLKDLSISITPLKLSSLNLKLGVRCHLACCLAYPTTMEVFFGSRKRARTFNIDGASSEVTEMPSFSLHEEENATILEAAFGERESDPTNYNYNYNRAGGDGSSSAKVARKMQQEEALESAQKAFSELSQLLTLTGLLQRQEHVVMSNCLRAPGLESVGLVLPASQLVALRRQDFRQASATVAEGVHTAQSIVLKRQQTTTHLLTLRKFWRLAVFSGQGGALTGRDTIAVDCSYCSPPSAPAPATSSSSSSTSFSSSSSFPSSSASLASQSRAAKPTSLAIALAKMRPSLVPLRFGPDGTPLAPAAEQARPVDSLHVRLVHTPTGQTLVGVSLWQLTAGQGAREGPGGHLEAVHLVCLRRQHESMCRLLFACVKGDAAALSSSGDGSCRWIVAPACPTGAPSSSSLSAPSEADSERILSLQRPSLARTIDIAALSRAHVALLVSDDVQLVVEMARQTADASGGAQAAPVARRVAGFSRATKALARAMLRAQSHLAVQIAGASSATAASASASASAADGLASESLLALLLEGGREAVRGR